MDLQTNSLNDFALELANSNNEKLIIGFDKNANQYFIDRTKAGVHDFNKDFAGIFKAPRFVANKSVKLTLVVDRASVEIFADGGATVMTCIFFTEKPLNKVSILSDSAIRIKSLSIAGLKSIW
ncbi:GH32 C-terminal domain-containing protein [Mucilaginibacter gotjawali]|uniref:GH32 C-terminal domain-containing protein n=1 Tax=Mucilaginibacter gotjawali TaxID=1550579 RepID=UPI0012FD52F7|nr:GH32 C-terminal domain-containing protein [Mucilaginibacter gotjawali]